jgi:hypothetical protein
MSLTTSEMFDAILETTVATGNTSNAAAVLKTNYDQLSSHGNLTTYSTSDIFHACPRKFAIKKLHAKAGTSERINSPTFAFGHAVGAGIATYDQTRDLRAAIWEAIKAWDIDLFDEERKPKRRNGKSFWEAIWALYAYEQFYNESDLSDYDCIKVEATIAIDFEDGHFYSGHIDEVLRHRETGRYRVKENKTTGFASVDPALYANSDQALSYAIVIDMLGGADYDVMYTVYSSTEQAWQQFNFVKHGYQKGEWIQDQLLLHRQIDDYTDLDFFPKRGRNCFQFMRRCEYFDLCSISMKQQFGSSYAELPRIKSIADIAAIEHVDFPVTLSEIVNRQKQKLNESE